MPVILLKYRPSEVPDEVMQELVAALPEIVSRALDIPNDPGKRLTTNDIQVWTLPEGKFDVNIKPLQMLIPLHAYSERIDDLELRKDIIAADIHEILAAFGFDTGGFIWILPSSDTAFGKF